MQRSKFYFNLPKKLIAIYPSILRSDCRLLCLDLDNGKIIHKHFTNILDYLVPGDLIVFNDTIVINARFYGKKKSGGKVDILINRLLDRHNALVNLHSNNPPKLFTKILIENKIEAIIEDIQGALFKIRFIGKINTLFNKYGHMPLPHYLKRYDNLCDKERYQTIYGKHEGAIAAPTAGLHFDYEMMQLLSKNGINIAFVTLHIGAGTFKLVREDNITAHKMHSEWVNVSPLCCEKVRSAKNKGNKIVAVGTTSVRCLETASSNGEIFPYTGETNIFIYPGYKWKCVDALITNFHLPESTLLMLVSAFGGYDAVMNSYKEAINEQYAFYSYGDAMLIIKNI